LTFVAHVLLWLGLRLRRYPIVHVQNIDAPLVAGLLARTLLRRSLVVTLQGEQQIIMRQAMPLGRLRVRLMVRLAGRLVAITGESHRQYLKVGVDPRRICAIPNGIDTGRFSPSTPREKGALRERLALPPRDPIVVFAGRLIPLKRVDALIQACHAVRTVAPFQCLVVGDGPERTTLQALAHQLDLHDRVRFVGQVPDVCPYYQAADVFVLPSTREGLSVALLEAMSCGLCPLVSGLPGNRELVQHGLNGLVFPPDRPALLSSALAEALGHPDLCGQLGRAARDTIETGFSGEAVAARHSDLYARLV
jgi:glycosyltransferase involved in cell wall biosynthesis